MSKAFVARNSLSGIGGTTPNLDSDILWRFSSPIQNAIQLSALRGSVDIGVPQGSVLGRLLIFMYIADLVLLFRPIYSSD